MYTATDKTFLVSSCPITYSSNLAFISFGVIIGFCSDMIGYFLFQSSFKIFFGYTLNAMLAGFTYGLCFYKRRITFTKCLYARLVVNLIINVCLGSLWWKILYDLTLEGFYSYLFFIALDRKSVV